MSLRSGDGCHVGRPMDPSYVAELRFSDDYSASFGEFSSPKPTVMPTAVLLPFGKSLSARGPRRACSLTRSPEIEDFSALHSSEAPSVPSSRSSVDEAAIKRSVSGGILDLLRAILRQSRPWIGKTRSHLDFLEESSCQTPFGSCSCSVRDFSKGASASRSI